MSTALPRQTAESPAFAAEKHHGLLLVGHGTRDPRGLAEFRDLSQLVAEAAQDFAVLSCFLELAQPDIAAGVRSVLARGITHLTVAPLLLFAAGHAKRDIPEAVERELNDQNSKTSALKYSPALSCHEKILELSQQRFNEALDRVAGVDRREPPADSETLLILVARGSSHPDAIADMHRFTELRSQRSAIAAKCCFAAVAQPTLEETLAWAAQTDYRRIVVQPHLLFAGQVLDQIYQAVERSTITGRIKQEWIVTPHLGPSSSVAEAVLDLARRNSENA